MAVVRATCDECGDIELMPDDVAVRVCLDDQHATYSFRCPSCDVPVARPLGSRLVELLVASGATVSLWHLPDELSEPHVGDALTYDDLLDFHQTLAGDDWIDQLIAEC